MRRQAKQYVDQALCLQLVDLFDRCVCVVCFLCVCVVWVRQKVSWRCQLSLLPVTLKGRGGHQATRHSFDGKRCRWRWEVGADFFHVFPQAGVDVL